MKTHAQIVRREQQKKQQKDSPGQRLNHTMYLYGRMDTRLSHANVLFSFIHSFIYSAFCSHVRSWSTKLFYKIKTSKSEQINIEERSHTYTYTRMTHRAHAIFKKLFPVFPLPPPHSNTLPREKGVSVGYTKKQSCCFPFFSCFKQYYNSNIPWTFEILGMYE